MRYQRGDCSLKKPKVSAKSRQYDTYSVYSLENARTVVAGHGTARGSGQAVIKIIAGRLGSGGVRNLPGRVASGPEIFKCHAATRVTT